jgi:hypothetical protein
MIVLRATAQAHLAREQALRMLFLRSTAVRLSYRPAVGMSSSYDKADLSTPP